MRLFIAGGGTGGHLFPALAVARAVKSTDTDGDILFVGTEHGIEARIMPEQEFPIRFISARGIRGKGFINSVFAAVRVPKALMESLGIIRSFRPDVVLGVGGYASGPVLAAAVLLGIPTAIQEQNSVMGTTNRILSVYVDRVFISWENTTPIAAPKKTLLTGNPVRSDLFDEPPFDSDSGRVHIFIFGGSQGARSINESMIRDAGRLTDVAHRIDVIHQTGRGATDQVRQAYEHAGVKADVREFIHEMGSAYKWADIVVSRAGAATLAEVTAMGKPAVVVPYPHAIGDHQAKNAAALEAHNAVRVVPDDTLEDGALVTEILSLIDKPEELERMAENSRKLGKPEAARNIAEELLELHRSRM
jgi:UDP-N-acetylglucosamine--N-acetylmuramyl-(pentapeptide) pyrophosphoryl-undecaprenol N-acetylglucosamine transferase